MNLTILKTLTDLEDWRNQIQPDHMNFVPTMGCLHQGHEALIKEAKAFSKPKYSNILVSIFVNPLQFGENEDFKQYPRDLENDCEKASKAGATVIWAPSFEDIFPNGKDSYFTINVPKNLNNKLCGALRNQHFDGVATIVIRMLSILRPTHLFLGEKDWQQLVILKQLINELNIQTKVHSIPTIRDTDGLAYSSRNIYLSKEDRKKALMLPNILKKAAQDYQENNSINLQEVKNSLEKNNLNVEYIETVNPKTLTSIDSQKSQICLLAAAVKCGKTRLIDHTFLLKQHPIVAIDGPAGAGKSTVTKKFAEKLGLIYLDTGAMYRAVTWMIQEKKINHNNKNEIELALNDFNLDLQLSDSGKQTVILNDQDITNEIRSPQVTSEVSNIAAKTLVREKLTLQQKEIGKRGGLVAEGRDIGTAVFPNAQLKVFLTATPRERARRRAIDMKEKGFSVSNISKLETEIKERDLKDSTREIAPLCKAKDSKLLITDGMTIEEVVDSLIDMFREEIPQEVWPIKFH